MDIFAFDLIVIPVHLGMHWCLATIDLKRQGVFYYDSMGGDNLACLEALLRYLQVINFKMMQFGLTTAARCV